MLAFAGPGYLVAVGYMDPGNWATDWAAAEVRLYAAERGVASSMVAMFLQALSAKLGIATGRDLAQACREHYSRAPRFSFGSDANSPSRRAIWRKSSARQSRSNCCFIFRFWGVLITGADVLIVLALQGRGFRMIEAIVITLIVTVGACFAYEIFFAHPLWMAAASGLIPSSEIIRDRGMLYLADRNPGCHGDASQFVSAFQHRADALFRHNHESKREAVRYALADSCIALGFSFFINAAILVSPAAVFHSRGMSQVADISEAYKLLSPVWGAGLASVLFAVRFSRPARIPLLLGTLPARFAWRDFSTGVSSPGCGA